MNKRNIMIPVQHRNVTNMGFKPPKDLQFASENQLFEYMYIHPCTETNVNLLLNTCNFHCKFRFIFPLILSENAPNAHSREAKFQNFPGGHAPGPSQCTRAFGARSYFSRTNSELLPPGLNSSQETYNG